MKTKTIRSMLVVSSIFAASVSHALPILPSFENSSNYLGIHLGSKDSGADVFSVGSDGGAAGSDNRSSLGRINPTNDKPATEPGVSGPVSGAQTVPDAHTASFGGNFALLGSDTQIEFSDTDTYALDGMGVDCANSDCVKDNSNSNFFTPNGMIPDTTLPIGTDNGQIDSGNGVNEGVDLSALESEIDDINTFIDDAASHATGVLDLSSGIGGSAGYINNYNSSDNGDFYLSSVVTLNAGLNIIDIVTDGNDFNINNTNFIVDGAAGSSFIFLLDNFEDMLITNSRILAGENMGLNNILFAVKANTNDTHFNFSQSEVWGAAFWDLSSKDNPYDGSIVMNNVRGCGQWVSNKLGDWNDVSLDRCAFKPTMVPEPQSIALLLIGLASLVLVRKTKA